VILGVWRAGYFPMRFKHRDYVFFLGHRVRFREA
jgi:hypothetical protein